MSDKNSQQSLYDRNLRKKRVNRIKKGIILFASIWMLVCMLFSIGLTAKVLSLQKQLDILMESTIRSQQQENLTEKDEELGVQTEDGEDSQETMSDSAKDAEDADEEDALVSDSEDIRKVYLTFDDGPSGNTEKILDVLDEYQVKATFFVTGREDEASLGLYKEIVDRGHTIGMHSYSHKYNVIYDSLKAFKQDLKLIQTRIYEATGIECKLYRFPGGSSNQVSNTDMGEFIRYLTKKGITYFDWNVECGDATANDYSTDELVDNVMMDVGKFHTSVVLMHDAEDKPRTVEALPIIIEQVQAMDDTMILPIDDDTTVVQHVSVDSVME